jgi:hypothetical protein
MRIENETFHLTFLASTVSVVLSRPPTTCAEGRYALLYAGVNGPPEWQGTLGANLTQ